MTRHSKSLALFAGLGLVPAWSLFAQDPAPAKAPSQETAKAVAKRVEATSPIKESAVIDKIKDEGLKHSQVMNTLDYLTNVIGPRLTASPNMKKANGWTRDKLSEWGLKDAHLEAWGPFGRGWSLKRFSAQIIEPQCIPLIAYPKPWTRGLEGGPITGDVILFEAKTEADLAKYKGKLKNAILLQDPARDLAAHYKAQGARLSEAELLALADAPEPRQQTRRPAFRRTIRVGGADNSPTIQFLRKRSQFLLDEGVALLASPSRGGDGGTLFSDGIANVLLLPNAPTTQSMRAYDKTPRPSIPQIVVAIEHYNRLVRMIKQGETPRMSLDLAVQFHDDDLMGYNTVAEIPGTDLKDEVVMLGGHMDSWHSGTGATDNAAGVSVAMEAVRILQTLKIQPRRTIRIALWSGEEQGLFGSEAYVKEHFGGYDDSPDAYAIGLYEGMFANERPVPKFKPTGEYEKLSAYFNLDNGTGKIRGVYLEGNDAVRPIFRKWLEPFREMGAATITSEPTHGTDHESFDGIGLPGFQFIQDPIEYETRTHHSNMDTYERIQADDMKQASAIMAAFIYNTAMKDEKLPRKPGPAK
ncbi:MAG: putative aminopeptidase [Planctomycetota bacterium]|nr:putative aminopeptidase [Planctomycetota bacterium]